MTHQDKITANSLFWREMLDKLPSTILIFRIDPDDQAQLFFTNHQLSKDLDFSPDEYVLASESEGGTIASELSVLVDEIAQLSHSGSDGQSLPVVNLSTKQGQVRSFQYSFHVFQSRSTRNNFISVTLSPASEGAHRHKNIHTKATTAAAGISASEPPAASPPFIAESPVMKGVLAKADQASRQPGHIVIHGEQSTGKRTLSERIRRMMVVKFGSCDQYAADASGEDGLMSLESLLETEPELSSGYRLPGTDKTLILQLHHLHKVRADLLNELLERTEYDTDSGRMVRLICTSRYSTDQLVDQGKIPASLLYRYTFFPIPVPPLAHREEDLPVILKTWAARLSDALDLHPRPEFTDQQMSQLLEYDWPDNFDSVKQVVKMAVLESKDGRMKLRPGIQLEGKQGGLFAQNLKPELKQVMTFDDMNRIYLRHVLDVTGGKIYGEDGAASLLDMPPTTLQSKLKKLKVK